MEYDLAIGRALQLALFHVREHGLQPIGTLPQWWTAELGIVHSGCLKLLHPLLLEFVQEVREARPNAPTSSQLLEVGPAVLEGVATYAEGTTLLILRNLEVSNANLLSSLRASRRRILDQEVRELRQSDQMDELCSDRDEAIRLEKAKGEFLAAMSHEIRTPLTTIQGMVNLASEAQTFESCRAYVNRISSAAQRLIRLSNDILDLSRIQATRLQLEIKTFSLQNLLWEIESELWRDADGRNLIFSICVDPLVPDLVLGDALRLRQVLTNLVSNAFKFTEHGSVQVKVEPSQDLKFLRFHVTDTGIGIAPERQSEIYTSFVQLDSHGKSRQGAGLGLAIAFKLVELMEGRLMLESEPGRGSHFFFDALLPGSIQTPLSIGSPHPYDSRASNGNAPSLNLLVAEDHDLNRTIIVEALRSAGHNVQEVEDGAKAVEAYRKYAFHVILMDCQMPVMSGLEAIEIIRKEEKGTSRHVPILALTAHAMQAERQRLFNAGADAYLAKPFDRQELADMVADLGKTSSTPQA